MLKITQTKKTENNEMKNRIEDKSQRKSAVIVGVLILIGYGVLFSGGLEPLIVMLIELISGVAVIGIAFIMFPILKPYNKGLTLGYVVCKVVEGAILIIGGILLLSLSTTLLEVRDWIYVSQAYIFILGALIFYYLLYRSKLIPRFISVWGVIAAIMLLVGNLLEIMGFSPEMLMFLFLPIMLNEVFLAIWLIVKGFNADAIVSKAVKTDVN